MQKPRCMWFLGTVQRALPFTFPSPQKTPPFILANPFWKKWFKPQQQSVAFYVLFWLPWRSTIQKATFYFKLWRILKWPSPVFLFNDLCIFETYARVTSVLQMQCSDNFPQSASSLKSGNVFPVRYLSAFSLSLQILDLCLWQSRDWIKVCCTEFHKNRNHSMTLRTILCPRRNDTCNTKW